MLDKDVLALILATYPNFTSAVRASVSDGVIAANICAGKTTQVKTLIGFGQVLDALGPVAGAALLGGLETSATSNATPAYWGLKLLEQGNLDISLTYTQAQFAGLVSAGVITSAQQSALIALCEIPLVVSTSQVSDVLNAAGY